MVACPHVDPGYLYPEEVSACIVQQLLEDAAQHTNVPAITKAVITVPAYFGDEQRDATIAAGALTHTRWSTLHSKHTLAPSTVSAYLLTWSHGPQHTLG